MTVYNGLTQLPACWKQAGDRGWSDHTRFFYGFPFDIEVNDNIGVASYLVWREWMPAIAVRIHKVIVVQVLKISSQETLQAASSGFRKRKQTWNV
ncbi:MAG: hypothetical protein BGO55_23590 [Sphingobacteriales bacterium 50-39]|nr:MAG: hypothetical protein BGO55_23590 [Sphingobacteriales bacterium 50-39]